VDQFEAAVTAVLARDPRPPREPGLFTSNVLFGEPGIYPDGPPMTPASGPGLDDAAARVALRELADVLPAGARTPVDAFDDPALRRVAAEPLVRAGLAALVGTVVEPALDALLAAQGEPIGLGPTASPGRVVGPAADGGGRCVNDRYRAEHPALVTPSLAHALLWSGPGAGRCEEVALHALTAMVHAQWVARRPALAHLGTELARRQNSLLVTLLHSRDAGSAAVTLVAPTGPGTIPGGAPAMQTRDFAGIPFVTGDDPQRACPPELLTILGIGPPASGLRYEPALFGRFDRLLARGWLTPGERVTVAVALGLLRAADVSEPVNGLALGPALAVWA
jgi:hypothetical protein